MDLNLDTLKREILEQLEASGLAIFHSIPGGLEGLPLVLWDTERYPDYQMFLETAKKAGSTLVLFASREFEASEIDESLEELDDCDFTRDERRDVERRLRDLRVFDGITCALELAFDHQGRMYVYEVRPDWYDEFLGIGDEISEHMPVDSADDDDQSLGGYFSRN